ncbi:MAG: hypothetical protein WDN01_15095 [Rhizomicrobium sp.]
MTVIVKAMPVEISPDVAHRAKESAQAVCVGRGLKYRKSRLSLHGNSVVVIFSDEDPRPGFLGNSGKIPAFEVELSADGETVLGVHFVR